MHYRHRRLLTPPDTRRRNHPHIGVAQKCGQAGQQILGASQLTTQTTAHPHREARRFVITPEHLKVMVKSGHLIHLGHGNIHLPGQSHQMALMQAPVSVIELVQQLNQQITPMRRRADQRADLRERHLIHLAPLEAALAAYALAHVVHRHGGHDGRGRRRLIHGVSGAGKTQRRLGFCHYWF